jgi:hypothetical protein
MPCKFNKGGILVRFEVAAAKWGRRVSPRKTTPLRNRHVVVGQRHDLQGAACLDSPVLSGLSSRETFLTGFDETRG